MVVFTHRHCQLKTKLPRNVLLTKELIHYISEFNQQILSHQEIQLACSILSQETWQATPEKLAAHIQQF